LQLGGAKALLCDEAPGPGCYFLGCGFAAAVAFAIAVEEICGKGDPVPQRSADQIRDRPAGGFALNVQTCDLDGRVEAGIREVVDLPQCLLLDPLEVERVLSDYTGLQLQKGGALIAAADLAQSDDPLIGDEFQDRSDKVARVNPGRVAER